MATYLINILGLKAFNDKGVSNYISGAILLLPMALITYSLNSKFVFKTSNRDNGSTESLSRNQ